MTDQFISLAQSTMVSQGLTDLSFVVVPHPVGMLPAAEVVAKVDMAFKDIIIAATQWQPAKNDLGGGLKPYPAPRFTFTGSYYEVNDMLKAQNWSISLPLVPPTEDRVAEMLQGTKRDPAEVVWVVPPRQGILTVELVAVLGVMAGAKPEHMPLLLAIAEAFSTPEAAWRSGTTTTASTSPMIIISGPIIKELGIEAGTGTMGPQNPVANAAGYFINLVGDIVGGSIRAQSDMSTHGSSSDFVAAVFSENAESNPWGETLAQQLGFKAEDNVVTVVSCYPYNGNIDHSSTSGAQLLDGFAVGIAAVSSGRSACFTEYGAPARGLLNNINYVMVVTGPEHAATIAKDFTKAEAAEYIAKNALLPHYGYAPGMCEVPESFGPYDRNTLIPRFKNGKGIFFVVTGGAGKQSQFWTPFPQVLKPSSVLVGN